MKIIYPNIHLCVLLLQLSVASLTVSYPHFQDFPTPDDPSITYTYNRFPDIEKHCGSIISAASDLQPNDNRGDRMKKELSFLNGDWYQKSSGAPLMPFNSHNPYGDGSPLKLVSFWLMDVDPTRRAKNTISVRGLMVIGITRSGSLYKSSNWLPRFDMQQGTSKLTIPFEGIYVESKENGGQRLMCLLGNASIPTSSQNVDSEVSKYGLKLNSQPSTAQDKIMLVLQYPKTFSLTTRGISGEMTSLNHRLTPTYFDKIHISSQLGSYSKYHFGSDELTKACSPYPYRDYLVDEGIQMFKGDDYCEKLREFVWSEVFEFVSAGNTDVTSNYHNNLGPFILDRELEATAGDFDKLRIMVQDLECEPGKDQNGLNTAKVAAVFRVIQISKNIYRDEERTGISSTTLSAEGLWHSSNGQLCMIGCLGLGAPSDRCNTRICLYFPLTLSITQQSIVFGTITGINEAESHRPLWFEKVITPKGLLHMYQWNRYLKWSYNYSKIIEAREFQERNKPSKFSTTLRKTLFWYPSSKGDHIANFSFLADVLSVQVSAAPRTLPDVQTPKTSVDIVVLSIGSLFGRHWPRSHQENLELQGPFHSISEAIEISGQLSITGREIYNISLFFEGLYDPNVGQMYFIGCRDVQDFQNFTSNGTNREAGYDCLIEIKVEYSPRNARWLLNPNIKFSINSKRNKEDPLYLSPVSFDTFLLSYKKKWDDVLFRKSFEDILRILMLMVAAFCLKRQLPCNECEGHPTAYISLVMLGVQAIGYSLPLISGDEALFKWKEFTPYKLQTKEFNKLHEFLILDCCIKILLLFALVRTIQLLQKVRESRRRYVDQCKRLNFRIPSDKLAFLFTLLVHIVGFFIFYLFHEMYASQLLDQIEKYTFERGNTKKLLKWWREMESYGSIVQDFFLLPQIIGNALWGLRGKPLRKLYYIGFTMVRLLLQVYDYARDPVPNPSYTELEFLYLGLEPYAKLGNILIGTMTVILALTVYFQQRCTWQSGLTKNNKLEECEDLDFKSDSYKRLLSE